MRRTSCLVFAVMAVCASLAFGQDDGAERMRKALEGRMVLVKMDLPAIDTGIDLVVDSKDVTYDTAHCNHLLKEYGVAVKKGSRSRITGLRITGKGIEIDLDGGGLPGPDWVVGDLKLVEPAPVAKSDREIELERQLSSDHSAGMSGYLRSEIEYERQRRYAQDDRNRDAFKRVERLRGDYIDENRKNWGSKVVIVVRPTKEPLTMREMVRSLAKYVELLPSERPAD
ncbi:MAG: hypothetical protein AB7J13_03480 [Pyrinomonadaceae bacterium]